MSLLLFLLLVINDVEWRSIGLDMCYDLTFLNLACILLHCKVRLV